MHNLIRSMDDVEIPHSSEKLEEKNSCGEHLFLVY
jgi:hypothetical protein